MTRLPIPGSDDGTWGDILNDFLRVTHDADGTLKASSVGNVQLDAPTRTQVAKADASVQSINGKTPSNAGSVMLDPTDLNAVATSQIGAANGVASLDSGGYVPTDQVPDLSGTYAPLDSAKLTGSPTVNGHALVTSDQAGTVFDPAGAAAALIAGLW